MTQAETSDIRHFLVTRCEGKLATVEAFDDGDEAVKAYGIMERNLRAGCTCVLLGAERLSTCIATHGNWFDEPNGLLEALLATPEPHEDDYPPGSGPYGV